MACQKVCKQGRDDCMTTLALLRLQVVTVLCIIHHYVIIYHVILHVVSI